jgi:hypothetical protein
MLENAREDHDLADGLRGALRYALAWREVVLRTAHRLESAPDCAFEEAPPVLPQERSVQPVRAALDEVQHWAELYGSAVGRMGAFGDVSDETRRRYWIETADHAVSTMREAIRRAGETHGLATWDWPESRRGARTTPT